MKNQIEIILGKIEKQKGDVVLNWATHAFKHGPIDSFYPLLKAGGVQPLDSIETFKANISSGFIKEGDALSTIAGLLNFNLIIHCLILEHNNNYDVCWMNIIHTLKQYKKRNICRNLYVTIPIWTEYKNCISEFVKYQIIIDEINFIFVVKTEKEKNQLELEFKKISPELIKHKTIAEKFDSFMMNLISR